jgi:hypothetical protein
MRPVPIGNIEVNENIEFVTQGAIFPGQLVGCILNYIPTALAKVLTFVHQLLTRSDQVIRDFFSLAA